MFKALTILGQTGIDADVTAALSDGVSKLTAYSGYIITAAVVFLVVKLGKRAMGKL